MTLSVGIVDIGDIVPRLPYLQQNSTASEGRTDPREVIDSIVRPNFHKLILGSSQQVLE